MVGDRQVGLCMVWCMGHCMGAWVGDWVVLVRGVTLGHVHKKTSLHEQESGSRKPVTQNE